MNNFLKGSLFFITGAAIASFITYKVVDKKYKKIADEEIASVREMYKRKIKKVELDKDEEVKNETVNAVKNNPYSSFVTNLGYSNNKEEEKEDMVYDRNIEVIPPEDFGEYGYKTESLTYYADKVLTFDNDELVSDVAEYIGSNALNTFGEYEDDSVFVRNHDMKTDFEILLDSRRYSDVVETDD